MSGQKNKRAKSCDIPQRVKSEVWERDNHACVLCGSSSSCLPSAHFISRQNGGMGIPENVVTLCTGFGNGCHYRYDNGTREERQAIKAILAAYLSGQYPGWNEEKLIYRKWV